MNNKKIPYHMSENKVKKETKISEDKNIVKTKASNESIGKKKVIGVTICAIFIILVIIIVSYINNNYFTYINGTYVVGDDIPAGEYYVAPAKNSTQSEFYVANSSDDKVVRSENVINNDFVRLQEGEYVVLNGTYALPVNEMPDLTPKDGIYSAGVYRVGIDIPAGEYELHATSKEESYYSVTNDMNGNKIDQSNNLEEGKSTTITISDGQFLTLENCYIDTNI